MRRAAVKEPDVVYGMVCARGSGDVMLAIVEAARAYATAVRAHDAAEKAVTAEVKSFVRHVAPRADGTPAQRARYAARLRAEQRAHSAMENAEMALHAAAVQMTD